MTEYHRPDLSVRPTFEDDDYEAPMIEQMECPKCHGNKWVIWGEPFESHGTLVTLTAECTGSGVGVQVSMTTECGYQITLGTVDGNEMKEVDPASG